MQEISLKRKPVYVPVGEFKPVERQKNAISLGESGRVEAGMKHKSYNFLSVFSNGFYETIYS